jgi:hypothetical protein
MACAAGVTTRICRAALEPRVSDGARRGVWLAALILAATATYYAYGKAEQAVVEEDRIQKREAQVARTLGELRQPWYANPHSGVAELMRDRLKVWLAATPSVEIDAEYERELGGDAQREIPIRVTFLNDSFLPVTARMEAGLTPLSWTVEVRGTDVGVLRKWNVEEREPRVLQPAERRDYRLQWDGRDDEGKLVPPGDYAIVMVVTTADGQAAQTLPFNIRDSGPIAIVEVDATTEYIRHQESLSRWRQTRQEGVQMLDPMRFQRFPR